MKKLSKYTITFIILIIIFLALLVLVSLIPSTWMKENVKEAGDTLSKEGNHKSYYSLAVLNVLHFDNYSDALMINTAYSIDSNRPLYSALTAKKNYIPGITKKVVRDFVGNLESNTEKYDHLDQVNELKDTANDYAPIAYEYARYWHGYLVFLRPLLLIFNYWQLRIFLIIVLAILAIIFLIEIQKKFGNLTTLAFLLALLAIDYFYLGVSLLNTPNAIITMVFSIIMLKRYEKIKDFGLFFFIMGCIVGYITLLDYPLITYGIGIILYTLFKYKNRNFTSDTKNDIKDIIKFGILWFLGYGLTWISKWIIIDILYKRNLIYVGLWQVLYRSIGHYDGKAISPLLAILYNFYFIMLPFFAEVVGVIVVFSIRDFNNLKVKNIKKTIPFIFISIIPIIWMCLFRNHSLQHAFFTYRMMIINLLCTFICLFFIYGKYDTN